MTGMSFADAARTLERMGLLGMDTAAIRRHLHTGSA